ncbi:hypothetical protein K488DRAFT_45909 [Vararia minispora EC-137]|uniref:Uncharacterized protein n=1 Tax=Vararia minispora EC-137 TaxID=1314806 RepID=A0ACB8QRL3_9AGAM|nr:hypothetical protein K488DRAFT_45909 [Vararia minispora EC-137]
MSFSGTPLGQGRRLDHHTFLNKANPASRVTTLPPASSRPPNSPPRPVEPSIPTAYSYGAPTQATRSPPKPISASSSRDSRLDTSNPDTETSQDLPALARFARLKERESAPVAQPDPVKWAVKDTSVQIANAFQIAADSSSEMAHHNPNDSWNSSTSRKHLPRSSSVEYEKETQTTRQLPIKPPSRSGPPPARSTGMARQPLGKTQSAQLVPASEDEEDRPARTERGKSPFESVADFARRTAFYLRPPSQEPQPGPSEVTNGRLNGHNRDESYDYAAEEADYQQNTASTALSKPAARKSATHRRGHMSEDAKAYRPNPEELEESSDEGSDDGRPRRRKKKKGKKDAVGGPLSTLPVTSYDKRRKKRKSKSGADWNEEDEEDDEVELDSGPEKHGERVSLPLVRGSVPPEPPHFDFPAESTVEIMEAGLPSVEEVVGEEQEPLAQPPRVDRRAQSAYSFGGLLGKVVNLFLRVIFLSLSTTAHQLGRALGFVYDIFFRQPARLLSTASLGPFFRLLLIAAVAFGVFTALRNASFSFLPISRQSPVYQAPDIPASNIAEISARLQALENALAGLSLDTQQTKVKIESSARAQHDVVGRLEALQTQLQKESSRAADDRKHDRSAATQGLTSVRTEVDALRELVSTAAKPSKDDKKVDDAEARARIAALEARVEGVEGDVRDALEIGKHSAKTPPSTGSTPAWWTKITNSGKTLNIRSSDGQDVTDVIGHLVETAVSRHAKDGIAKADFALSSGGGRIIPTLTSPTLDVPAQSVLGNLFSLGGGQSGRPPIWAIHHDSNLGECWPFAGAYGHISVKLARLILADEVTIDHVPKELALDPDLASAPRKMELWARVEGADNLAKVRAWEDERARQRAERGGDADDDGSEEPDILPRTEKHIRLASFEYDVHSSQATQTFTVDPEVRELEIDVGIITLRVLSNWGAPYTCLYRLRVHGQPLAQAKPDV